MPCFLIYVYYSSKGCNIYNQTEAVIQSTVTCVCVLCCELYIYMRATGEMKPVRRPPSQPIYRTAEKKNKTLRDAPV